MNPYKIISLALAIALVVLSVKLVRSSNPTSTNENDSDISEVMVQDSVINNILTRVSVRQYQDKSVEKEKVETMLKAAMSAPTAVNKQPWHFVVVQDKEQLMKLSEANKYAAMLAEAPLAIVVCGDMMKALDGESREFWVQDCSAASENILLAAHALGLGAVWTGLYPHMDKSKTVGKVLDLPDDIIPLCIIVIGYPAENPAVKDKWNESNISYDRY